MKAKQQVKKQVKEQEEYKEEVCKRCDMEVNECECWELDAIEEMMREEW
jgi:hypothetical protein